MIETIQQSLNWAIVDSIVELEECLFCRKFHRQRKLESDKNSALICTKAARKYIQRIRNFRKLLKEQTNIDE
jgi:hypothetical protein